MQLDVEAVKELIEADLQASKALPKKPPPRGRSSRWAGSPEGNSVVSPAIVGRGTDASAVEDAVQDVERGALAPRGVR
jgi:hypothetical protein